MASGTRGREAALADQSAASLLEHVACALCGGDDVEVVYEAQYEKEKDVDLATKFRASGDELLIHRLVRCGRCGLQFVSPRITADAILAGYVEGADPVYVSQMTARERTFAIALARIERHAPRQGRLLDIGTAAGAFLRAARDRGWQAVGVEPNRWLAEWGRRNYGVLIEPGSAADLSKVEGPFDVITLWDVIEHTTEPLKVLGNVNRLLAPGGILVVNYPDIGSWIARVLGRRWPFLSSVHLYYFTRPTMTQALERTGFEAIDTYAHFQRLELNYVVARGAIVSRPLSAITSTIATALGIGRKQIPYWLGQTCVIGKKVSSAF